MHLIFSLSKLQVIYVYIANKYWVPYVDINVDKRIHLKTMFFSDNLYVRSCGVGLQNRKGSSSLTFMQENNFYNRVHRLNL